MNIMRSRTNGRLLASSDSVELGDVERRREDPKHAKKDLRRLHNRLENKEPIKLWQQGVQMQARLPDSICETRLGSVMTLPVSKNGEIS